MQNAPIPTSKNTAFNSPAIVGGDYHIGDIIHFHFANTPFTLSHNRLFFEKNKHDLFDTTIPCFDCHQTLIADFLQNPRKQILLISGANETGKTHLLRNI